MAHVVGLSSLLLFLFFRFSKKTKYVTLFESGSLIENTKKKHYASPSTTMDRNYWRIKFAKKLTAGIVPNAPSFILGKGRRNSKKWLEIETFINRNVRVRRESGLDFDSCIRYLLQEHLSGGTALVRQNPVPRVRQVSDTWWWTKKQCTWSNLYPSSGELGTFSEKICFALDYLTARLLKWAGSSVIMCAWRMTVHICVVCFRMQLSGHGESLWYITRYALNGLCCRVCSWVPHLPLWWR